MKRFFIALSVAVLLAFSASATIFYVPNPYPTIQSAVNVAQAGDTVMVAAGVYREHVEINTSLYLLGEDMFTTIIDAYGSYQCVLIPNVANSYGKISGFTMMNSGIGIQGNNYAGSGVCVNTQGTGSWEICWNIFKDNPDLGILSFDGGTVERNIFENNGYTGNYRRAIMASSNSHLTVENNDFRSNNVGIYTHSAASSIIAKNNIITDNTYGIQMNIANYTIQYNDVWSNGTNYSGCTPGIGDISADPLYVGGFPFDYHLSTINSPCVDTGDPSSPLDPDGTRADMGVFFYNQGGGPLTVTLTPLNPPILIPANGGSFEFNIEVENTGTTTVTFDIWTMATLPNGNEYGPIIGPIELTLAPGASIDRDRTQAVPAGAPTGTYSYDAYVGLYPSSVWDEDHFNFEKLPLSDGGQFIPGWDNWGESFADAQASGLSASPNEFALRPAYPNPFNPETNLTFELTVSSVVSLAVFDINGREVANLGDGWYPAGIHEMTFDASQLPSGVYFARLTAGNHSQTQKLLLIR